MNVIPPKAPNPVLATLLGTCPGCNGAISVRLQLALESIRAAARHPITLELLILCRQCGRQFAVSLHPSPEQAS
jgi:hypothetical protein